MNKATELYRRHLRVGRTLLTLLILAILLVTARALLPKTVVYSAEYWLRQQGIETQIENVDFAIYDGKFVLFNAEGKDDAGQTFRIDRIALSWNWRPLRKQTIHIEAVELEGITLDTFQYSDSFVIAGIRIDTSKPAGEVSVETPQGEKTVSWGASLKEVVISDLNTCYAMSAGSLQEAASSNRLYYCIKLDRLHWKGDVGYNRRSDNIPGDDLPLDVEGDFVLDNLVITDRLLDKTALSIAGIEIDTLVFDGLASFGVDELTIENLRALQDADGIEGHNASISRLRIEKARIEHMSSVSIQSLSIENPAAVYTVDANGQTNIEPWLPAAEKTRDQAVDAGQPVEGEAGTFEIVLNDINVSGTHLCYRDRPERLDYCLMNDALKWNGVIRYGHIDEPLPLTLTGTLAVDKLTLNNRALARDLVRFDTLSLNNLAASGLNASLAKAGITDMQLMQLQAGEERYAAGFEKLGVETIDYEHDASVAINSIMLTGLHAAVHKDENGAMSFEEWLPAGTEDAEKPADADQSGEKPEGRKRPKIRIGSINLKDTKSLAYQDLTTSPEMDIGMSSLNVQLKDLDSSKPEQESPLKLSAKTSRHGTIDIQGNIKPFDEKISFDATGKIGGFDLRAISPLTQQQIGHIIRSGQLDADLKLLAQNGVLDSSINLTLQHFQLKPKSEKDAQALNKTFGMPVNQSLKLLRSRDDSISLEIPITGDLSKPEFDPMDAIVKATTKATTFTLITFYTPYGLAYAGGNILFDLATALRFEPVTFNPGDGELNPAAIEQLDKLSKLMKERPQVHLTFCGKTSRVDRETLFPPSVKEKKPEKQEEAKPVQPTPDQLQQLRILADTRQEVAKKYLVGQKQIEHERIVLCAPEHDDSENAISGVEINI